MRSTQQPASTDGSAPTDQESRRGAGASLLSTLLRAAVPVALITFLAYTLAYSYSEREPTEYEATSRVVLSASTNFSPISTSFSNSSPDRYVQNQVDIMTTIDVLNRAAAILADGVPGEDLLGEVDAVPAGTSDGILVTAEAGDPELAARRADAVAAAYAQFTTDQVNVLAEQAVAVSAGDEVLIQDIRARAATFGDGVTVIQPARIPSDPVSPTPQRDAYLAAAAAFLLSAGLALSLRGRRRPAGPEELAAEAGGPFLGEVPVRWFGSSAAPVQPGPGSYAMALQALRYRMDDEESPSVLLSAMSRETSAASALLGLAAADAAQGRSVVIVDATPDGHLLRRAGVPAPALSLTAAWAAGTDFGAALSTVPALAGPHGGRVRIGRDDAASAEVLRGVLTTLSDSADLVLVDAGPAVSEAAAFSLLSEVRGAVAVVHGKRGSKELREFRRRLALAGGECAGVLVTRRTWLPSLGGTAGRSVAPQQGSRPEPRERRDSGPAARADAPRDSGQPVADDGGAPGADPVPGSSVPAGRPS
ncbi:hypothetical protein [Modestobacter sp. I12A-02662]|uniref:hypothetical protein n=1 Tax=Modestobacter sp. I12A-02662 TaxID=1730496 RepID=UPI0034DFA666